MQSAMGNFDSAGVTIASASDNWCKSKILSLEDEIKQLKNATPVVTEHKLLDELLFLGVNKDNWEKFTQLAYFMLANGATLYELQQRLMGLE